MEFSELKGKTFASVDRVDEVPGWRVGEGFVFTESTGKRYGLSHCQDCCESVYIKDVVGDLSDLVDSEILVAEERSESTTKEDSWGDISGYTFYEIRTNKGSVTIQFEGSSNGYYGIDATLYEIES